MWWVGFTRWVSVFFECLYSSRLRLLKHVREFLETRIDFLVKTRTSFSENIMMFLHADYQLFIDKIKIASLVVINLIWFSWNNKDYHQTCLSFSYVNMRSSSPLVKSFNNKRVLSGTFV